jgi:hypothetical protein
MKESLQERYQRWRQKPESDEVFMEILRHARDATKKGGRFGVKFFAELVRHEKMLRGERTERFKVNNSYVSLLARELLDRDPSLAPFFSIRKLATERDVVPPAWLKQVQGQRMIPTLPNRSAQRQMSYR